VRAIRYHDEARLELIHEVGYYTAVSARLGERFDKAIQSAAIRCGQARRFPYSVYFHPEVHRLF